LFRAYTALGDWNSWKQVDGAWLHDRQRRRKGWRALFGQVGDGLGHAVHLEAARDDDGATVGLITDGGPPRSGGSVVSLDAGQWLVCQRQVLRCRRGGRVERLALNKAEQQVRDMRLGGRDCLDGQFTGMFVMLQDQGPVLQHRAIAAWRLEKAQ
jgi:hypothetical protein